MEKNRPITIALLIAVVAVAAIVVVVGFMRQGTDENDVAVAEGPVSVLVSQIVEHPALDAVREGLLNGLADYGYSQGDNLTFEFRTAQGNPTTAAQIARDFIGQSPDVLVGIATPTAQALASATQTIPIVFSAVTDPVGAGLIDSLASPGGNVTGLSDFSPVGDHLAQMRAILPEATRIGVVYNSGEDNSLSLVRALESLMPDYGFEELIEATVTNSTGVKTAVESLAGSVDVLYALTDNTIASTIAVVVQTAKENNLPIYAGETSFVAEGAIASIGFDYYQVGYQTAEFVARILGGQSPDSIPARVATGTNVVVNPEAAEALGITLPEEILNAAQ